MQRFLRENIGIKCARKESLFWWRNAWRRMRAGTPRRALLSVVFEPIQIFVISDTPGLSLSPKAGVLFGALAEQLLCRCQWRPKMSASGISEKTPESFYRKERRRPAHRSMSFEIRR